MNRFELIELEESVASVDSLRQTAVKPFMENNWSIDTVFGYYDERKYYYAFGRKLLRDHLVEVKGKDFHLTFDPLWDLQLGWDLADTSNFKDSVQIFNNTRGLIIQADIGKRVSFQTSVYENQSRFPLAYQDIVDSLQVVPGHGRIKVSQETGWDYNSSYGMLSVQATDWLNLQLGHGKHFIGHGYRSMLLSDNAFNYPYLKSTVDAAQGKIKYLWMYANLQGLERLPVGDVPESLFRRKGGSFYFLNWMPHPRVEIGLFEGIIWNEWNDSTGTQPFNYQTVVPVIGVNSLIEMGDTNHHALLGLNGKIKLTNQIQLYGQLALDFKNGSDSLVPEGTYKAYQVGLKSYNLFVENLDLQLEFNLADDGAYANVGNQEDYFQLNQSLAHPLGSSFQEWVGIVNYRYDRYFMQAKGNLQKKAKINGIQLDRNTEVLDLQIGYHLNPKTNMNLALGFIYRNLNERYNNQKTQWFYIAFRTSLHNKYWDI